MSVLPFPQHPRLRIAQWSELSRWDPKAATTLPWAAAHKRPLGDALVRHRAPLDCTTPDWHQLTLRFDGSMEVRRAGSKPVKGALFAAPAGYLVFSKIDVRNGAIGIVPAEWTTAAVSSEFPIYRIRPEVALPGYLTLLLRSAPFKRLLNSLVVGASGRQRIEAATLTSLPVPLPPLATQQTILEADAAGRAQAAALLAEAAEVEKEATNLFLTSLGVPLTIERPKRQRYFTALWSQLGRWSIEAAHEGVHGITEVASNIYPMPGLGTIGAVSYGMQKSPDNRPGTHPRPYLRVANVKAGHLDLREIKFINVPDAQFLLFEVLPGDLLFVEGNGSRNELGRAALWNGEIENCVHQNHLIKVRFDREKILPKFAERWFNTQVGRMHFFRSAKSSSGLGTINSKEVRAAPIPLPPLEIQQALIAADEARTTHATQLRQQAEAVAAESLARVEKMILGN